MKGIKYDKGSLYLLDQTLLPVKRRCIEYRTYQEVAAAIREMKVRGAPAIGVAAAYGLVLASCQFEGKNRGDMDLFLAKARQTLAATRPTAVNLFWALDRMAALWENHQELSVAELRELLEKEARLIEKEDLERNRELGRFGRELVPQKANILTHCNAGALATAGYGTALGIIRSAKEQGKDIHVYVDETRPLLQGARLTAWELLEDKIEVTLITDSMAGYVMQQGKIDLVIVGADRIAANGDVANKIGTYTVAVLAEKHHIPFYVAAPVSTIDLTLKSGEGIPIEERDHDEVRRWKKFQLAPEKVKVYNPAFDITPAALVAAVLTDCGIARPPYEESLHRLVQIDRERREKDGQTLDKKSYGGSPAR